MSINEDSFSIVCRNEVTGFSRLLETLGGASPFRRDSGSMEVSPKYNFSILSRGAVNRKEGKRHKSLIRSNDDEHKNPNRACSTFMTRPLELAVRGPGGHAGKIGFEQFACFSKQRWIPGFVVSSRLASAIAFLQSTGERGAMAHKSLPFIRLAKCGKRRTRGCRRQ